MTQDDLSTLMRCCLSVMFRAVVPVAIKSPLPMDRASGVRFLDGLYDPSAESADCNDKPEST